MLQTVFVLVLFKLLSVESLQKKMECWVFLNCESLLLLSFFLHDWVLNNMLLIQWQVSVFSDKYLYSVTTIGIQWELSVFSDYYRYSVTTIGIQWQLSVFRDNYLYSLTTICIQWQLYLFKLYRGEDTWWKCLRFAWLDTLTYIGCLCSVLSVEIPRPR